MSTKQRWLYHPEITCPYCDAEYISMEEIRPLVLCEHCKGKGAEAKMLGDNIGDMISNGTKEEIEALANTLAPGYWEFCAKLKLEILRQDGS